MMDRPAASYGPREAMPLDGFLDQALDLDLSLVDKKLPDHERAEQQRAEFLADRDKLAADAAAIFATAPGRHVLEWLCDFTLRRPVWMIGLGPEAVAYCARREGENITTFLLLKLIAEGRHQDQPFREGT